MAMKAKIEPAIPTSPFFRGIPALAAHLNVSEKTIARAMRKHLVPFVRFGGSILFRKADVERAIERLTVPAIDGEKRKAV